MRNAVRCWSLRSVFILALLVTTGLAAVTSAVAENQFGQPKGITDQARDLHDLYLLITAIAVVVFLFVEIALILILVKFRKRNDELPKQTHGNTVLEIIWTTIPVVIVLILFVGSFIVLVDVEKDAPEEALTVEVQGFQFQWQFTYNKDDLGRKSDPNLQLANNVVILGKGGVEGEPTLTIPVDEPVEFALVSHDVIHSFYVRDFLYKLDVVPGRDNRFQVTARELGTFHGQCAELCGLDHALMRFTVHVVTRAEFDKFLADNAAAAAVKAAP